jgi:hypothetical protein
VIGFGASAVRIARGAPNAFATSTADAIAAVAPMSSAAASGQTLRLTSAKLA